MFWILGSVLSLWATVVSGFLIEHDVHVWLALGFYSCTVVACVEVLAPFFFFFFFFFCVTFVHANLEGQLPLHQLHP